MNLQGLEPRRTLWALGEVCWVDATGIACCIPATIEDTSPSGACVRVKTAIEIGSSLTVKWHREQFCGVARNQRPDRGEFLVGIQRHPGNTVPRMKMLSPPPACVLDPAIRIPPTQAGRALVSILEPELVPLPEYASAAPTAETPPLNRFDETAADDKSKQSVDHGASPMPAVRPTVVAAPPTSSCDRSVSAPASRHIPEDAAPVPQPAPEIEATPDRHERNAMPSNPFFRKLWRPKPGSTTGAQHPTSTEVSVTKSELNAGDNIPAAQSELLSCEDIYRASGILGVGYKYDIAKIVEMLESKHIRELPKEVRRASVLMALDAAGTPVDEVLTDATRRQHALNSYESGQQKHFEQFEADKLRENAQINVEIERVTARYAERIRQNLEQVAREKEAFHTWQAQKEAESQKISEAVALCGKQPANEPTPDSSAALAKAANASPTGPLGNAKPPAVPIR